MSLALAQFLTTLASSFAPTFRLPPPQAPLNVLCVFDDELYAWVPPSTAGGFADDDDVSEDAEYGLRVFRLKVGPWRGSCSLWTGCQTDCARKVDHCSPECTPPALLRLCLLHATSSCSLCNTPTPLSCLSSVINSAPVPLCPHLQSQRAADGQDQLVASDEYQTLRPKRPLHNARDVRRIVLNGNGTYILLVCTNVVYACPLPPRNPSAVGPAFNNDDIEYACALWDSPRGESSTLEL